MSKRSGEAPGWLIPVDIPGWAGRLEICTYADEAPDGVSRTQETVFVRSHGYRGMEDNDIRGFLDGTFLWAWNQPTQYHTRIGRVDPFRFEGEPKRGEHELFRVLMRWDDIVLPPRAEVLDVELRLTLECGMNHPLRVYLYAVKRDWDPGHGGTGRDNTSPPAPGEVWWNKVSHHHVSWGLPGASFASSSHPESDTGEMYLAECLYEPGDPFLVLSSDSMSAYVDQCVEAGLPLRFLLKLADYQEDVPGAQLVVYSANFGDDHQIHRRPRLKVRWQSQVESSAHTSHLNLEYGRGQALEPIELDSPGWVAASIAAESQETCLTLEYRWQSGEMFSDWVPYSRPFRAERGSIQFRATSAVNQVALGSEFGGEILDTWIVTQPPETADVVWTFESPTGSVSKVSAEYAGDYRWVVRFVPREVGRWTYKWQHAFNGVDYVSPSTNFDVVAQDTDSVLKAMSQLVGDIRSSDSAALLDRHRLRVQFSRLIRSGTQLMTPGDFEGEVGRLLRDSSDQVRESLTGERVPRPLPLDAHPRPTGGESPRVRRTGLWRVVSLGKQLRNKFGNNTRSRGRGS